MSPRHFARVFRAEVGCTPAAYVERVRVEVARRLLETTEPPVDDDRRALPGFGTRETLRRAFARRVGASPTRVPRPLPSRARRSSRVLHKEHPVDIACLLFDGITALDIVGPVRGAAAPARAPT